MSEYQDLDGNPCSLRELCVNEPEWAVSRIETLLAEHSRLDTLLNTPELNNFRDAVVREAAHQREKWPKGHDAQKSAEDWMWLIAYVSVKATQANRYGDHDKYLHHIITTAACCANWHASVNNEQENKQDSRP